MRELNEKIARWRWPDTQVYIPRAGGEIRVRIDGQTTQYDLFTKSLDTCFKWVVPKLEYVAIGFKIADEPKALIIGKGQEDYHMGMAETPALAFCLAVEKLIDSEATK